MIKYNGPPQSHEELVKQALARVQRGLAAPREIYDIQHRSRIDWGKFPAWARPIDPSVFDGCCHEG
jgi:hypothetical protein